MIWDHIRGHQPQVEMFRRAIGRERTAHAYLFVGPQGIGKRLFAQTLAQCFFCQQYEESALDACGTCAGCKQVLAGTHPDLLTVGCPEGKRELPIELLVGAVDRRGKEGLCHDLSLRPMSAARRIAIIDDAETMNEASANALLKTLEEPPPGAILFLMTPDTDPILPTIRSRCQPVRFSPLPATDICDLLIELDLETDPQKAAIVAEMSEGSLDTAQQLLNPGLHQLRKTVEVCLRRGKVDPLRSVKLITDMLNDLGNDTASQRQNMRWVLQFAINELRQQLRSSNDVYVSDQIATRMDRCFESELHLRQAMPVPLCLEALFADLAHATH